MVAIAGTCKLISGSPKRFHVRRTSGSVMLSLAVSVACPIGMDGLDFHSVMSDWFIVACGPASVKPEEAQTATAPPFGASISVVERLLAYTSWKNPLRQSIRTYTGRWLPLASAAADVSSSRSANDHCCSD